MKLGLYDSNNFLEFYIEDNKEEITNVIVKGKVDFISFCKDVELLNFNAFCREFIEAFESLEGKVKLFDYVGNQFYMQMIFDKRGYVDIKLTMSDENEKNKVTLNFDIEQSYLNDFYNAMKIIKSKIA